MRILIATIALIAAAFVINYSTRLANDSRALEAAAKALPDTLPPLRAIEQAANQGMANHVANVNAKLAEQRADARERAEAEKPKAYRWKDDAGTWHLSDVPPKTGAVEIIPLLR